MKNFRYFLIFLLSFPLFLYLSFPLERVVERELCKREIGYTEVEVEKFPPKLRVKGLELPQLPFSIEEAVVLPDLESILSGDRRLNVSLKVCGGEGEVKLNYPLSELTFHLKSLRLSRCVKELPFKVRGLFSAAGEVSLRVQKALLEKGRGSFSVERLELGELSFGPFSLPGLNLGKLKGTFVVKRENVVSLEAEGKGKDADVKVRGYINVNLRYPGKSYVNLRVKVKPKVALLKGRTFTFRVKGFAENVTVVR